MDLARFKLEGLLGEGTDLQVFSATDTATGDAVVVKRPHPKVHPRRNGVQSWPPTSSVLICLGG